MHIITASDLKQKHKQNRKKREILVDKGNSSGGISLCLVKGDSVGVGIFLCR